MRLAIKIAYQGKGLAGSQIQPGVKTVQSEILKDISKVDKNSEPDLKMAGRTDSGVRALGNVVVVTTKFKDPEKFLKALNAVSSEVYYRAYAVVDGTFNPRHASERIYRYILPSEGLDISRMKECARLFVGEHDFKRFCRADERSTIVDMQSVNITENNSAITIEFKADHFLWNMIRRITAAIRSIGQGRSMDDVKDALNGKDVTFGLARPDALTLTDVLYDGIEFVNVSISGERTEEERFTNLLDAIFLQSLDN